MTEPSDAKLHLPDERGPDRLRCGQPRPDRRGGGRPRRHPRPRPVDAGPQGRCRRPRRPPRPPRGRGLRRGGDAHPGRGDAPGDGGLCPRRGGLRRRPRRRIDDRARQGDRLPHRCAADRRRGDLRRLGSDAGPRPNRERGEDHGPRRLDPPGGRDLRSGPHPRPPGADERRQRLQRHGPRGRGPLRPRPQPGLLVDGPRRPPHDEGRAAEDRRRPARSRGPRRSALRFMALRDGARHRRHGAAPQALPHPRRQLRPAARRDPHGPAAAFGRLQRRRGHRCPRPRRRALRWGPRRRAPRPRGRPRRPAGAARPRPCRGRPRPRRRSLGYEPLLEPAADRPGRGSAHCSSAPGPATGRPEQGQIGLRLASAPAATSTNSSVSRWPRRTPAGKPSLAG